LSLESKDIAAEKRQELLRLFPEVQSEGGRIDFDQLKRALGESVDAGRERYGMTWPGKADCFRLIQSPSTATLLPVRDESVRFDETDNLIIEGDNLEVLKLLQKGYLNKIKMIYIDPPYNTGNDFIYLDDFTDNLRNYLQYTAQVDADEKRFSNNLETDGRFHSKWLNMMYPRLYLARNLLADDGVIFISIDDSEITNLKAICDQIFGSSCLGGIVARVTGTPTGGGNRSLVNETDSVLIYFRTPESPIEGTEFSDEDAAIYNREDADGKYLCRSLRRTGGEDRREDRPSMYYPLTSPDGTTIYPVAPEGYESRWRCGEKRYKEMVKDNLIEWQLNSKDAIPVWQVYQKFYVEGRKKQPGNLWDSLEGNKKATRHVKNLFGGEKVFSFPKPVGLIRYMMQIANVEDGGIVCDFFAGSGSTAEAVISQNMADGGLRSYLLIQLPEPITPDNKQQRQAANFLQNNDKAMNIAELTKERVRRVIQRQEKEVEGKLALRPDGKQLRAEGFRVFKLSTSNFKVWDAHTDEGVQGIERQMELAVNHIMPDRSAEDLFYEILLKSEYPLTAKVESFDADGIPAFSVEDDSLIICVERKVTEEAVAVIAKRSPSKVIFLDEAFSGNDQLKANAKMNFESAGVKRFETV
jgi:adenine-specific DNA-methyltransferase